MTVSSGGNLQSALDQAVAGDVITLTAGATFTGHFSFPSNSLSYSSGYITLTSSGCSNIDLGARVSPSSTSNMAKIVSSDANPAITISGGSVNNIKITCTEVAFPDSTYGTDLIAIGTGSATSTSAQPSNIVLDRLYVHAGTAGGKRGVALNSNQTLIKNSYFSGFISVGSSPQDTQAIAGWNGAGPYELVNDYLEAGTEILAFGGSTPGTAGLITNSVMVMGTTFSRPSSWESTYGGTMSVKNWFEIKNGARINLNGNDFHNNWASGPGGQFGDGILVKVECSGSGNSTPWATARDIHITNSTMDTLWSGFRWGGVNGTCTSNGDVSGIFLYNNVLSIFPDPGLSDPNLNYGRGFSIFGVVDGDIWHNTVFNRTYPMVFDVANSHVTVENNFMEENGGIVGNSTAAGNSTLNTWDSLGGTTANFWGEALLGPDNTSNYPSFTYFPATVSDFGFRNFSGGDYGVASSSIYYHSGSDGQSFGANVDWATTIETVEYVNIVNKNSGMCAMPNSNAPSSAGTDIMQWACEDGYSQMWLLTPVSGGYKIINKYSGLAFTTHGSGTGNTQETYTGASNQIFNFTNTGHTGYWFISPNAATGTVLDVFGLSDFLGSGVGSFTQNSPITPNQEFMLVPQSGFVHDWGSSNIP